MTTARHRLLGALIAALLVGGVVAAVTEPSEDTQARQAPHTWECVLAFSGFTPEMPVGLAAYLLEQRLTRGGYPPRGQAFYGGALDDLRDRDPREPLGRERFGPRCEDLESGDLDPLPSPFDDGKSAEAIVQGDDGRFEQADLGDVVDRLLLRPEHGRPVYARVAGDDAMVVVERPDGRRGAFAFSDPDDDGTFVEANSEGMRLPVYTSADGSALAGVAFFTSTAFAYASTSEPGAVLASLSSDGLYLPLIEVHDGVADLSDAWPIASECKRPFTITWTDDSGRPVDELTGTFYCGPID